MIGWMVNMTTYFISGGLGFLGQYIVKAIHDHDPEAELRILVRTQRKTFLGVENLGRVRQVHGDLLEPETYIEALQGVDFIVHPAAMVSFRKSEAEAVFRANVIGTRNLMQSALEAGCGNFIFISSISAVDFRPPQIADETMVPNLEDKRLNDTYGYTKLVSEMELREHAEEMRVIILNPSVILGPGSKEVDKVAGILRFLPVIPIIEYINSFVDVRDVARAVVLALTKGRSGERYIVTATNVGMIEFVKTVLRIMEKKALIVPLSNWGIKFFDGVLQALDKVGFSPGVRSLAQMNIDKACSTDKIREEMGWEPTFSLEQSIRASAFPEKEKMSAADRTDIKDWKEK
ncbi:MAG: NAD-dependent epimerase/dehydratase family protein [Anaerolineales bacterium]|nr:NAD-dependent epimerase/dehydratase family protein [Anaerolineales bacterium]